jgi:hypothetical protein
VTLTPSQYRSWERTITIPARIMKITAGLGTLLPTASIPSRTFCIKDRWAGATGAVPPAATATAPSGGAAAGVAPVGGSLGWFVALISTLSSRSPRTVAPSRSLGAEAPPTGRYRRPAA